MDKKRETDIPVTASGGNVFADMGLPEPEEELTKAQLASHIRQVIKRQRLTQVAAAGLLGIDQPKVSAAPQWQARALLQRAPHASSDNTRPGCGHHSQDEAAQSAAWPHSCRLRGDA